MGSQGPAPPTWICKSKVSVDKIGVVNRTVFENTDPLTIAVDVGTADPFGPLTNDAVSLDSSVLELEAYSTLFCPTLAVPEPAYSAIGIENLMFNWSSALAQTNGKGVTEPRQLSKPLPLSVCITTDVVL